MDLPVSLRTAASELRYQKDKAEGKCAQSFVDEPSIREWKYWRVINNNYHYDMAYGSGHMLIPKRIFARLREINKEEFGELLDIHEALDSTGEYASIGMNFCHLQSIPGHLHFHLPQFYKKRSMMRL